jgi:hypothetical protein
MRIASPLEPSGAVHTNGTERAAARWLRAIRRRAAVERVFICYRRDGSGAGYALNLRDRLTAVLGVGHVFLDVAGDAIAAGDNWEEDVRRAIRRSTIVLAIIDRRWAERILNADDAVRFELASAFAAGSDRPLDIFPVLVDDARMPARDVLPPEIASLSALNAFLIRPATAAADLAAIVRTLTGRASPEPTVAPDRYDALVLGLSLAFAVAVWWSFFRDWFNTAEKWLWAVAALIGALGLMGVRRALAARRLGRGAPLWRQAVLVSSAACFLLGLWYASYRLVYRVPAFAGVRGLLVARLRGDADDSARALFANRLARTINSERLSQTLKVTPDNIVRRRQERLLGRLTDPPSPLIALLPIRVRDDIDAKRYGSLANAGMVVWGARRGPREFEIAVSFPVEADAIDEAPDAVVGATDIHEIGGTVVENAHIDSIQRALVWLLVGYHQYHSQPPQYDASLMSFRTGLEAFTDLARVDTGLVGALGATLSLYEGNALLYTGRPAPARDAYARAEGLSPLFIESANNHAHVLRLSGHSFPPRVGGDGQTAREKLESVAAQCAGQATRKPCAYVRYNLAATFIDQADLEDTDSRAAALYEQGRAHLVQAIALLRACESDPRHDATDCRLLAEAHQSVAYVMAKHVELSQAASSDRIAAVAAQSQRAMDAMRRLGLDVPSHYGLTTARVTMMRREWLKAVAELTELRDRAVGDPTFRPPAAAELHLLLAAAQDCAGDTKRSQEALAVFRRLSGQLPQPQKAQFREIVEMNRFRQRCAA